MTIKKPKLPLKWKWKWNYIQTTATGQPKDSWNIEETFGDYQCN